MHMSGWFTQDVIDNAVGGRVEIVPADVDEDDEYGSEVKKSKSAAQR